MYYLHSLLHLKSNIDASSSLNNCAAWPFENYKQKLKRKVKGKHNSVVIFKRIMSFDLKKTSIIGSYRLFSSLRSARDGGITSHLLQTQVTIDSVISVHSTPEKESETASIVTETL